MKYFVIENENKNNFEEDNYHSLENAGERAIRADSLIEYLQDLDPDTRIVIYTEATDSFGAITSDGFTEV